MRARDRRYCGHWRSGLAPSGGCNELRGWEVPGEVRPPEGEDAAEKELFEFNLSVLSSSLQLSFYCLFIYLFYLIFSDCVISSVIGIIK